MRKKTWAYAKDEKLSYQQMLKVKYQGIRPAPGYPSQPEHTEKNTLWDLLDVKKRAGIDLTKSLAMMPASAVCALVFAHPKSKYFAVGHINEDQAQSYAKRKNISLDAAKDALRPILNE